MDDMIKIYEVGPRDGLQNEATPIKTEQKLHLIDGLVAAGLRHIEATSFVHPHAVSQLGDADEVMKQTIARHGDKLIEFTGLVVAARLDGTY